MTVTSKPVIERSGERFTEQQLLEILKRAADRETRASADSEGRFSLEEIQQIAAEVGIEPEHVADAAAELQEPPPVPGTGILGAPTVLRFERWIDGEVPTSAVGELIDIARQEVGVQGQVAQVLDSIEWRGRNALGTTFVAIVRRNGRTKISVHIARTDAAAIVAGGSCVGGVLATAGIATALATPAAGALAVVAAVVVSLGWASGGTVLAMRTIWRRSAKRWTARAHALGVEISSAAQRAIDAARMLSD